MNSLPAVLPVSSIWRRASATLGLVAAFAFAINPTLVLAQALDSTAPAPVPQVELKPKNQAKPKKHRHMASDTVSDELNRREAERAAQVVRDLEAAAAAPGAQTARTPAVVSPPLPAAATPVASATVPSATVASSVASSVPRSKVAVDEPATVPAVPPRAAIVTAALTPDFPVIKSDPRVPRPVLPSPPAGDATAKPTSLPLPKLPASPPPRAASPQPLQAQAQPPAPAPAPIPIPPPATAPPAQPTVVSGAPGRAFAQSQIVPTQQPTLTLEVNKGTAIKLPGPATTVFVAAPDIADVQVKSPGMIYVFAKKPGDTVLYAVDDQDRVLLNTIVSVTSPISRMKSALDGIHPGNGITYGNQGETIVLGGSARSAVIAEDARRLALQQVNGNALKVISNVRIDAPTQVQLRVKVAEVQRNALKRVGINWQNINNIAQFAVGPITIGGAISTVSGIGGSGSGALAATALNGGLTTFIDFLATQSMAHILAEPNLIAMSGETASFLAGGEIPVLSPQPGLTGSSVAVTYKQVGISLSFTPTIIGDRINLKVAPEVSQVTTNGQVSVPLTSTATVVIPAIETRRASTTVELGSGQSFAIAGLLQQTSEQDITKLPWLGDIPILGALFKSDAYQRAETELVIIITPYLVEPTNGPLQTPLTDQVPPTDVDRILLSRTAHPTAPRQISVGREPQNAGPTAGFKLD